MRTYTVTVMDDETGMTLSHKVTVPRPEDRGTHFQDLSGFDYALAALSPEICPFDCDHCHD